MQTKGIVLGLGAIAAGFFLLRGKRPALPEVQADEVLVALFNPPKEATMWQLILTDYNMTVAIRDISGQERLDIAEPARFRIPQGLEFPLRVVSLQLTRWNETRTALIQLYYVQSIRPYLWDWDKGEYSDKLDPTWKNISIHDFGSYYYNVSREKFEKG